MNGAKLRELTFVQQILLNSASAVIALVGVFLGMAVAGRREKKSRHNEYVSRLVEKQFELYQKYHEILDRNVDALTGDRHFDDQDTTYVDTHFIERDMRMFASNEVLAVADLYRDCVRLIAMHWNQSSAADRSVMRHSASKASSVLLAAIRADLGIDALTYFSKRSKLKSFKHLLKSELKDVRMPKQASAPDSDLPSRDRDTHERSA
jgi:hypothetical protein